MFAGVDIDRRVWPKAPTSSPSPAGRRAKFARWFRPSELPATVAQIRETAQDEGAPAWVIEALDGLDAGQRDDTIGEVWEAASPTPREEDA